MLPDHLIRPPFTLISPFLALPFLRALWPLNAPLDSGNLYDLSPHARTLTRNGGANIGIYNGFVGYMDLDGVDDYLSRADEAGLDFTGDMTLGGWFWADALTGSDALASKDNAAAQRSYILYANQANGWAVWGVSGTGSNIFEVTSAASSFRLSGWHYVVGRFKTSTEIALFLDGVKTVNTTSIPATIFDSTTAFNIGAQNGGILLDGRAAMCFMCGDDLSDALIQSLFAQTRGFFDI